MKTLTIHFDDENTSKDINLETLEGGFYDGGNDPYISIKCAEVLYGEYSDGETIDEDVLYFLEYLLEDSGKLDELNNIKDIQNYFEYMTETIYR